MRTRTSEAELVTSAIDAVTNAFQSADIVVEAFERGAAEDGEWDATLHVSVDSATLTVAVEVKSECDGGRARELVQRHRPRRGVVPMLVADRVTADAREVLSASGWSWLDRRGRMHLRAPRVRIDLDVPVEQRAVTRNTDPFRTRAGLSVAYWLSTHPGSALSPRRQAEELELAPSSISVAVRNLTDAGVVGDDGAGIFPELFWELAAAWSSPVTALASVPKPDKRGLWRRGGTAAAVAYGAPMVASQRQPFELYVASPVQVANAARQFGTTAGPGAPATVRVAPTLLVFKGDVGPAAGGWPTVPLVVAALDIAQDRARGREILNDWVVPDAIWR